MPTGDTGEKMIMKDHDILIAVYTLQQEMTRRFDSYIESNNDRIGKNEQELQAVAREQIRVSGEITSLKGMYNSLDERMDKFEAKSFWMDATGYLGILIAGVIAWFKN